MINKIKKWWWGSVSAFYLRVLMLTVPIAFPVMGILYLLALFIIEWSAVAFVVVLAVVGLLVASLAQDY